MIKRKAEVIPVIKLVTEIGKGTDNDPYRAGIEYWDTDGNLLFVTDATEKQIISYEARPSLFHKRD